MSSNFFINTFNKLIQLKRFSDKWVDSMIEETKQSVENVVNINLINNSVIDGIKVFGSDLKIIESNQKSHRFKCFWPKCHYKTYQRISQKSSID